MRYGTNGPTVLCPSWTLPKRRKLPWVNSSIRQAISERNNYWKRSGQTPHTERNISNLVTKFYLCYMRGKGTFSKLFTPQTQNIFGNCEAPEWQDLNIHPSHLRRTTYSYPQIKRKPMS